MRTLSRAAATDCRLARPGSSGAHGPNSRLRRDTQHRVEQPDGLRRGAVDFENLIGDGIAPADRGGLGAGLRERPPCRLQHRTRRRQIGFRRLEIRVGAEGIRQQRIELRIVIELPPISAAPRAFAIPTARPAALRAGHGRGRVIVGADRAAAEEAGKRQRQTQEV